MVWHGFKPYVPRDQIIPGVKVYLLFCPQRGILKIGESKQLPWRIHTLRLEMPRGLTLDFLGAHEGRDMVVHDLFFESRLPRQRLPSCTEWFRDDREIRRYFADRVPWRRYDFGLGFDRAHQRRAHHG